MNSKTNGEADEDSLFLENILDKLYDFGKKELASGLALRARSAIGSRSYFLLACV